MAEHASVGPVRLVQALKASGCRELGRRSGAYVRMDWPPGSLLIPLDVTAPEFGQLMTAALTTLGRASEVGDKARQVLDTLEGKGS